MAREPRVAGKDRIRNPKVEIGKRIPSAPPKPSREAAQGKAISAQSVKAHAVDTFGSAERAEHWMNRPNPLFHRETPLQVIQSDPSSVEAELVRIDYGVYI